MEPGQPSKDNRSGGSLLPAVLAALCVAWSASASAANDSALPCDYRIARDLQSLEVPLNELAIRAVDHEIAGAAAAGTESSTADSVAVPVLDLTPRVISMLDAVFDNRAQQTEELAAEETQPAGIENQVHDEPRKTAPVTLIERETELRGFQSQMYQEGYLQKPNN